MRGAFCDGTDEPDTGAGAGGWNTFPDPGGGPAVCSGPSAIVTDLPGLACSDDNRGAAGPGAPCKVPHDCLSVCCVDDGSGWLPADGLADGGASDASAGDPDAGDADPGTESGASVPDANGPRVYARRVWACQCGFCISPGAMCALGRAGKGLGGP